MRSPDKTQTFYFQACANALGGFLEHPEPKNVPSQASVSLAAVGGFASARTGAFNLDEVVSCASANTRVSGRRADEAGGFSTLVTAVVEGLNILEVVTAERVVAQLSIHTPFGNGEPRISLAGSRFEGLKIGGCEASVRLNEQGSQSAMTWLNLQQMGRKQAEALVCDIDKDDQDGWAWVESRYGWMSTGENTRVDRFAIGSLVDGVTPSIPGRSLGHIIEIPDFGRIFLGELLVSRDSVQLSMVRAELGCNTAGSFSASIAIGGGHLVPP